MSVAEDGNEQEQRADRTARHRVPPTAAATARVPALPEPFNPAKPTFPTGAAIPRQRRSGPTAIATAAIPTVPIVDDDPFPNGELTEALPQEPEEDPFDVELRALDAATAADTATPAAADPFEPDEYPVAVLPVAVLPAAVHPAAGDGDPATVGTLAGEVRASAAGTEPPADAAELAAPGPDPVGGLDDTVPGAGAGGFDVAAYAAPAPPAGGPAPVVVAADDSPTVADYVPPAFAIITDDPVDEDGTDYRGSRRKLAAWRRYPVGAVAVAVLLLLVTAAVVLQLVGDSGDNGAPVAETSPQRYPGVGGLPELTSAAQSPSPSATPSSASPSPSRSKTSAPAVPLVNPSASPSKSPSPTLRPLTAGQLRGAGSGKCLEYRTGDNDRVTIDNCDQDSRRTNQRWTFQGDGTVRADGRCLDVQGAGTGNGNAVQVYGCNGTPAQQWTRRGDGTLLNPQSGRCLDVQSGGTGAGSPVIIWDCASAPNQQWTLQPF